MVQRRFKDYLVISLKGLAMGAADVVPGVSGGTIAFITGIYEELVTTISNIDLSLIKTWKKEGFKEMWHQLNANFLVALLSGIAISIFSLMKLMSYLLETFPVMVWSFFFGLVLASVWYIAKQIPKWKMVHYLVFILSTIGAFLITRLTPVGEIQSLAYLFLCGALAICAMILPGISGAFILVLLGAYKQILEAVSNFDLKVISAVGLGAIVGILSFSRLLKWLFQRYESITLALLTGFVFGSLNKIWPWKNVLETKIIHEKEIIISEISVLPMSFEGDSNITYAVILAILGFGLILLLEKWSYKSA
jgi:putative membrane protein